MDIKSRLTTYQPSRKPQNDVPAPRLEPSGAQVPDTVQLSDQPVKRGLGRKIVSEALYWTRKLALGVASIAAMIGGVGLGLSPARLTGANKLHKLGIDGSGTRVAVMDQAFTTFGPGSEDVVGVLEVRSGKFQQGLKDSDSDIAREIATKQRGFSFHGNAMTNIITGEDTGLTGVAPGAEVIGLSVVNEQRQLVPDLFVKGLEWIKDNHKEQNIKVVSASLAYRSPSSEEIEKAQALINELKEDGVIVVAAAGNYGPGPDTTRFPANLDNVISVGAHTPGLLSSNWDDRIERYSSRGGDESRGPDLTAPGGDIYTKDAHGTVEMSRGTSNAAPMTAGGFLLLSQAFPEATYEEKVEAVLGAAQPLTGNQAEEGHGSMRLWESYLKLKG